MKENLLRIKRRTKLFKTSCVALSALITLQVAMWGGISVKAEQPKMTPKFLKGIKVNAEVDNDTKWSNLVSSSKFEEIRSNYNNSYTNEKNALKIGSAEDLATFAAVVNSSTETDKYDFDGKYIKMTADIDLKGYGLNHNHNNPDDSIELDSNGNTAFTLTYSGTVKNAWNPIGTSNSLFKGTFDGCGHEITNMVVLEKNAAAGLFGETKGGLIKNLGIGEGSYVVGSSCLACAGGLVGHDYGSITITNSYVSGAVSSCSSYSYVGGLVGRASFAKITNSYIAGPVSSCSNNDSYAGGLVGFASFTNITNSYSYKSGSVSSYSNNDSYTGGLVGFADSNDVAITNSYVSGPVSSYSNNNSYVGGIVGHSNANVNITNSYVSESVSSSNNGSYVGGLVGYSGANINITNSYVSGLVYSSNNDSYAGGLVGNSSSSVTINNSYWNGANAVNTAIGKNEGTIKGENDNCKKTYEDMTKEKFIAEINEGLSSENEYIGWPGHTPTFLANRGKKTRTQNVQIGEKIISVKILVKGISESENLCNLLQNWVFTVSPEKYVAWMALRDNVYIIV